MTTHNARLQVRISDEQKTWLDAQAAKEERHYSAIVRDALEAYKNGYRISFNCPEFVGTKIMDWLTDGSFSKLQALQDEILASELESRQTNKNS